MAPAIATSSPVPPSTPPNTPDPAPPLGTPQLNLSVIPSGPLIVGQEAALLLTISNTGSADAIGPLTVTDSLPAGLQFGFAPDDSGCTADGQTVTCTSASPLPAGGSMTLRLPVTVSSDALERSVNVATVSSPSLEVGGVTAQSVDILVAAGPAIDSAPASAAGREPPATGGSGEASTRLVYVVQDGDTLPGIATTVYGDPDRAADLYASNQDLIDGQGLAPGVELIVP
ncbi:MAG: hypothetical protein M3069_24695 [Chloroflexota bacterium]|nr:hypothetical protein [Chloroflexota bacterium]